MVHTGSRSVLVDDPAQMLLHEAGFLLIFGICPLICQALLDDCRDRISHELRYRCFSEQCGAGA